MKKYIHYLETKKQLLQKEQEQNFKSERKRFGAKDYLAPFEKEKLCFLNDSQMLMPNGNAYA